MLLKRGFAVKESEECGTNGTMALLTLSNPEEALGALAVYALEGYKSKNDTGMGVSCSSGMGAGKICGRQEQERPRVRASRGRSSQEREHGREREARRDVQQAGKQKLGTEEGSKELRATAEAKTGPCPVCKERHVYQRKLPWGSLQWPSNRLQECKAFQALSPPQRAKVIKEQGGCVMCMSWAHTRARCNKIRPYFEGGPSIGCQEKEGSGVCRQPHHRMLHGSKSAYASAKW